MAIVIADLSIREFLFHRSPLYRSGADTDTLVTEITERAILLCRGPGACILYHDPDIYDIGRIRKLYRLLPLRSNIKIGEYAVHIASQGSCYDAFVVIDPELNTRPQP